MPSLNTILVVDDSAVNRAILSKILSRDYTVLEAEDGACALALLEEHAEEMAAIMLDLVMPVMDGYTVLESIHGDARYQNLPLIVMTENDNSDNEIRALSLGAWDFVAKPYSPQIIRFRLKNAIDRSQLSALKQLKYLAEYDALTGIYNKTKFFEATREMIDASRDERFVFFRFDVDRFQLINSFFGTAEGDRLLIYIAEHLAEDAKKCEKATYGRIESDIVGFCLPYDRNLLNEIVWGSKKKLEQYNPNYDIVPSVGIYIIDDPTISVEEMYNRATLAAKTCKGNYIDFYAYYNESMSAALTTEQEITNEMNFALENGQFQIYLQPKYNIHTNLPCGAEALVRWVHPQRGLLSPSVFIPIFERNGFITKLDYCVWEQACKCLHHWKARGIRTYPLSVNVSRVNLYNPKLVETLMALLTRYQLEPSMLNLELTESAYVDNPIAMKKTMTELQRRGFTILMDDFGNGYSSLSLLKDIAIDILKIDMCFLAKTEIPGRGENIVASVIRMAKWLNIPVIAEGAETAEQVDFLRSVGCDFVQGYFFARPMPVAQYEELYITPAPFGPQLLTDQTYSNARYDDLFANSGQMPLMFNNALQAAAIYEFTDDHIEMIRVNEAYYTLLGHDDMLAKVPNPLSVVAEDCHEPLLNAFRLCASTHKQTSCDYMRHRMGGLPLWVQLQLRFVSMVGNKAVLIGELTDITMRKEIDSELQKYRASLLASSHDAHTVLIVDDAAMNRKLLSQILQDHFLFLEAESDGEAIRILEDHRDQIDLILLDITTPVIDGKEFLQCKQKMPELDGIPVIMIGTDDSPAQQVHVFSLGVNDYMIKPFIPEVVRRRVQNVLDSSHRFREMVKEYHDMSEQVKTDLMTGLLNRISAEVLITQQLESSMGLSAMLMVDIDHFKRINDTYGHVYGDKVIRAVAKKLRAFFRKEDLVARMGGDEFAVFLWDLPDAKQIVGKAQRLCESIAKIEKDGIRAVVTCSVGIALSSMQAHSFESLYQNADKALYNAKCRGRNTVSVYGYEAISEGANQHEGA